MKDLIKNRILLIILLFMLSLPAFSQRLSMLPSAECLTGDEITVIVQEGVTKNVQVWLMYSYISGELAADETYVNNIWNEIITDSTKITNLWNTIISDTTYVNNFLTTIFGDTLFSSYIYNIMLGDTTFVSNLWNIFVSDTTYLQDAGLWTLGDEFLYPSDGVDTIKVPSVLTDYIRSVSGDAYLEAVDSTYVSYTFTKSSSPWKFLNGTLEDNWYAFIKDDSPPHDYPDIILGDTIVFFYTDDVFGDPGTSPPRDIDSIWYYGDSVKYQHTTNISIGSAILDSIQIYGWHYDTTVVYYYPAPVVIDDDVYLIGDIEFSGDENRNISVGSSTSKYGSHLRISSGYGTYLGDSRAGNIYMYTPVADFSGNIVLNADTNGTWTGGFVGIGTAPQEALDVYGKIRVQEVDESSYGFPFLVWDDTDSTIRKMSVDSMPPSTNYWTFVDAATDTLKNNVATGDGPGVVAIKGNLELEPTNATATKGVVRQDNRYILHTYHEKGNNNLFLGQNAGNFTLDSSFNIGIGTAALDALTTGHMNVGIGYYAGSALTTGKENTAIGYNALKINTTGAGSTAVGYNALAATTYQGTRNTAVGSRALEANVTGGYNCAFGVYALGYNYSGSNNIAIGNAALEINWDASENTAVGGSSMYEVMSGSRNTALGFNTLGGCRDSTDNVAIGWRAQVNMQDAGRNTAVGSGAMYGPITSVGRPDGSFNTAIGYRALYSIYDECYRNTILGATAGYGLTTGDDNVLIGFSAGSQLTTESNKLYIENSNSASPLIWGDFSEDSLRFNGGVAFTGDISYEDTFWDDLTFPATTSKVGSNSFPDFDYTNVGLLFPYSDSTEITYNIAQFPHSFLGGTIYPHIHYTQSGANDTAEFIIQYKWTDMGEAESGSWTRLETTDCTIFPYTSGDLHQLAAFPAIDGSDKTYSSVLKIKVYRKEDVGYNGDILVMDFDLHFPISRPGSDSPYN